ncbi:hypothetical protein [Paenibacillus sp. y28]|uniref:hypothetical protein n=1 Tax=Paenibacillus sp. y28 TaxID=3129110 RepID=UPI003015BE80
MNSRKDDMDKPGIRKKKLTRESSDPEIKYEAFFKWLSILSTAIMVIAAISYTLYHFLKS